MGEYKTVSEARDAIFQLVEIKDARANDLDSLEIDDKLLLLDGKSVILMLFPDAIKLLHRLGVRTITVAVASNPIPPAAINNSDGVRMHKVPAIKLKTLSGIEHIHDCPQGKEVRQIEQGEKSVKGEDISGFWNLQDVGAAYLYDDPKNANRWAKGITTADAPSLIKIPSGNPSVNSIQLTNVSYYENTILF